MLHLKHIFKLCLHPFFKFNTSSSYVLQNKERHNSTETNMLRIGFIFVKGIRLVYIDFGIVKGMRLVYIEFGFVKGMRLVYIDFGIVKGMRLVYIEFGFVKGIRRTSLY